MPEVRKLWQTEGLFSDHYLKARLSKNDWWPGDAEAKPIWEFCKALYEKRAFALRRYDNEMTGLNREKRATAKQFLTDLKDFHDVDTHALKPKTKLDNFWELEAAEIFAHFRANKLRLKDSDEEKIRARFQKSKDTLVPLESSLVFTDELIDQIVHRLYGLTEAEIKIVSIRGCNSSMVRVGRGFTPGFENKKQLLFPKAALNQDTGAQQHVPAIKRGKSPGVFTPYTN